MSRDLRNRGGRNSHNQPLSNKNERTLYKLELGNDIISIGHWSILSCSFHAFMKV